VIAPIRHDRPATRGRDLRKARRWLAEGLFNRPKPTPPAAKISPWLARLAACWMVLVAGAYLWSMVVRPLFERRL
jgi:hypothetical protein